MKKTQSLKLMLLGLFAAVSAGAWAANGDVFTSNKLVLQEQNGGATVIGVASHNGTIVIPDEVTNSFANDAVLKVKALADNWFDGGTLVLKRDGGQEIAGSSVALNLKNGGQFNLKIEATQLKSIKTEQIQPLWNKITGFEVTSAAGLEAIPNYAFANVGYKNNGNATDAAAIAAKKNEIAALEALIAIGGVADQTGVPVLNEDGTINVAGDYVTFGDNADTAKKGLIVDEQYKGMKVYKQELKADLTTASTDYVILGEETEETDESGYALYKLYKISAKGGVKEKPQTLKARPRQSNDGKTLVVSKDGNVYTVATRIDEGDEDDAFAWTTTVFGLETLKQIAEAEYAKLLQAKTAFDILANGDLSGNTDTEKVLKALKDAQDAKDAAQAAWEKGQLVFDAWNGDNATYVVTNAVAVVAPTMTYDDVAALEVSTTSDPDGASKRALTEEEITKVLAIVNAMLEAGYEQNAAGGYDKPSFQGLEQAKTDTQLAYDAVAEVADNLIAYDNGEPAVDEEGNPINTIVIVVDDTTGEITLTEGANQATGLTYPQLIAALAEAQAAKDAATIAYNAAKDADENGAEQLAQLQAELAELEAGTPTDDVLDYNNLGKNSVLKNVKIESAPKLSKIGNYAFYGCDQAVLNGDAAKLPTTLTEIGSNAFQGAAKANPDFTTLVNLKKIGSYAFAQSGATDGDFAGAAGLASFGNNVFDDCKIVNLMLKGTPLEAVPGNLAQGLYREAAKFISACGVYTNYSDDDLKDAGLTTKEISDLKAAGLVYYDEENPIKVNTTLTIASLPEAITAIPDLTYNNCINLATLEGGIPATVETIGAYAFYATKITEFDLSANSKLTSIGTAAFGGNAELTTVILPTEAAEGYAGLTSLPEGVFECDKSLETIVLNPEIKCLPAGLFADTAIDELDLSNTQVTVLPDLFYGSAAKVTASATTPNVTTTLKKITLPETVMNDTNDEVVIPGLQVIGNHAFAFLQGITEMTIPSSVWAMGTEVFAYDMNLKEVTAMDSRLTNLGVHTFRNCNKLEKFTFVTLNVINPAWTFAGDPSSEDAFTDYCENEVEIGGVFNFDDTQFFNCPKVPELVLTDESIDIIKGQFFKSFAEEYSKLTAYQPTITLTDNGTNFSSTYYNEDYGTWIPVDEVLGVYTAYQNVNEMILYKAKRHNNYYKIPALRSYTTVDDEDGTLISWNEKDAVSTSGYWFSKGWDQENTFVYTANDGPITDIAQGSPAVIIIADKETINVKRVSRPGEKYQSTLDRDNELRIAGCTLTPNITSNLCVWATDYESLHTFYILQDPAAVVARGKVVFPLSAWQGTANGRLNVTIVDSDVTGIMSAKDYMKSLNDSEAIYSLQGVRVSTPVKGQLYIQGGKKFIQK